MMVAAMSAAVAVAQATAITGRITDPDGGNVKDVVVQAKTRPQALSFVLPAPRKASSA